MKRINLDESFLDELSELKNKGRHTEYLTKLSKQLKLSDYFKVFSSIEKIEQTIGFLDSNLKLFRDVQTAEMFEAIQSIYGDKITSKIKGI